MTLQDVTPPALRVAAIQMQVVSGEPKKNIVRAEALLHEAASQGAQAALLPELWTTGYSLDRFDTLAEEYGSSTLQFLRDTAANLNMAIIGGSFPVKQQDGVYSTCPMIGPDGALLASYSKEHLFPLLKEPDYLRPGSPGRVTTTPLGKWSSLICFDIRFPESARQLAYTGARILWVPAEWPHPRLEHWRTLLRARAIENQLFVVAANRCGHGDNSHWCGHSTIIDPWGTILAEAEEEEIILLSDLDMTQVDAVRARIPCFEVSEEVEV
ncbi:MAG: carbon-nitrogen family hydrolase [Chloroflexota bacterium]